MKRGTVFEHKHWLDNKNMPLLCYVTCTRGDLIYYTDWNPDGEQSNGKWWFDSKHLNKYVGKVLEAA
jgi:hypothetical protein